MTSTRSNGTSGVDVLSRIRIDIEQIRGTETNCIHFRPRKFTEYKVALSLLSRTAQQPTTTKILQMWFRRVRFFTKHIHHSLQFLNQKLSLSKCRVVSRFINQHGECKEWI